MKLVYPAIFHKEKDGVWVEFPDLEGCHSCGNTVNEAISNAKEALEGYCITLLEERKKLPSPSDITKTKASLENCCCAYLVEANLTNK